MLQLIRLVCLLFALFMTVICHGQASSFLRFQKTGQLSQNTVYGILQDRQGFLWVGTGDGLNRFDGTETRVYKPSPHKKNGFILGRILRSKLFEDDYSRLWFSTEAGVQYLDKKTGRFHAQLQIRDSFTYISTNVFPVAATEKSVWIAKIGSGLFLYDLKNGKSRYFPFPGVASNPEKFIGMEAVYDHFGRIWLAEPSGLYVFDTNSYTWNCLLINKELTHLTLSGTYLYCSNRYDLFRVNIQTLEINKKSIFPGKTISCLEHDDGGNIWLGTHSGDIYLLPAKSDSLILKGNINDVHYQKEKMPVYSLYIGRSNILWVGTDGSGLLYGQLDPPKFKKFPENSGSLFVKSIFEERPGWLWVGTAGRGILTVDIRSGNPIVKKSPLSPPTSSESSAVVIFIKEDSHKNLWVGYKNELYVKTSAGSSFRKLTLPMMNDQYNQNQLRNIYELENKWLLTTRLNTLEIRAGEKEGEFDIYEKPNLRATNFSFFTPFRDQLYIAGFNEGGLSVFARNGDRWNFVKQFFADRGFISVYRDTLHNRLWLGTDQGLIYMNPQTEEYRLFTEEDGLSNGFIYGIMESDGHLWVSTNGGLTDISLSYDEQNHLKEFKCKNYTEKDGLQSNEFNSNASFKGKDGTFYFGGISGLNWFHPIDVRNNLYEPSVVITDLYVNNKPADSLISPEFISTLKLDYLHNDLFIRFRGIEFSNPAKVTYAYQLVGWDHDKLYKQGSNEVRYNNLRPGKYEFILYAANSDGVRSKSPRRILIFIQPPFWSTKWFYLLMALLLMGLIILLTRFLTGRKLKREIQRMEFQQALDVERQRISQEMHDDIGAGLTQIVLMSQSARSNHLGESKKELDDIAETSRRLVGSMNEIVWSLNPEYQNLQQLMAYLREQLHRQLEYSNMHYSIHFPEDGEAIFLRHEQRRNILLVVKEIVNNSIKYSNADKLTIQAEMEKKQITFIIADDGCGFDTTISTWGNGLKNIRQRVEEIGGKIDMQSAPGQGCRYLFRIPY